MSQDPTFAPNSAAIIVTDDAPLPRGESITVLTDDGHPVLIVTNHGGYIGGIERRHVGPVA